MFAFARFGQQKLGPASDHIDTVPDKFLQHFLDIERLRSLADQSQHDDADCRLKWRKLKQLREYNFFIGLFFQNDVQSHLPARRLAVSQVDDARDAFNSLVTDEQFEFFTDPVTSIEVRDLGHDNDVAVFFCFEVRLRAECECRPTGLITFSDAVSATNDAAGREVGAGQDVDNLVDRCFRFVNQHDDGVGDFGEVVRRNAGRHSNGDSGRAVDEQVWKLRWQNNRFGSALIVRWCKVDGVVLNVCQHVGSGRRKSSFRITHGGGGKSSKRAEVALFVDHCLTHHPVLSHADKRRINRTFTVRVVVTAGVAADFGAFDSVGVWPETQIAHCDEDAALRRFQSVASVRQGSRNDDAHRVRQVGRSHFVLNIQLLNSLFRHRKITRFTVSDGQCNVSLRGSISSRIEPRLAERQGIQFDAIDERRKRPKTKGIPEFSGVISSCE